MKKRTDDKKSLNMFSIAAMAFTAAVFLACLCFFIFAGCGGGCISHNAGTDRGLPYKAVSTASAVPTATVQYAYITPQPVQAVSVNTETTTPAYRFSLTIGGMASFGSDITQSLLKDEDYTAQSVLAGIADYIHADLNLVVLDNSLLDLPNYTDIAAPVSCADALKTAGFDTVIISNDHSLDYGEDGLKSTIDALQQRGLSAIGSSLAEKNTFTLNGASVAVLAYTENTASTTTSLLESNEALLPVYSREMAEKDIQQLRETGCQFVMVFMHWGKEEAENISTTQREIAQALSECGADLIIGTNPHTAQSVEYITSYDRNRGSMHQTLVAWSMGCIITESRENKEHISSYLLHLDVTCGDAKATFDNVTYTPVYVWNDKKDGKNRFYTICSNAAAPTGMSDTQKTYMEHSLQFIQSRLNEELITMQEGN